MPESVPYVNSSCPGQKVSIPFHLIRNLSHVYHSVTNSLDETSREAYDILCWWNGEDLRFGNGRAGNGAYSRQATVMPRIPRVFQT
jgi:hypothetical protein